MKTTATNDVYRRRLMEFIESNGLWKDEAVISFLADIHISWDSKKVILQSEVQVLRLPDMMAICITDAAGIHLNIPEIYNTVYDCFEHKAGGPLEIFRRDSELVLAISPVKSIL